MLTYSERFWRKVWKTETCWVWLGRCNRKGYGMFWDGTIDSHAHRFAFGVIPEGLVLDHLCRNRLCVRPEHLEAVTDRENILRGVSFQAKNAIKTHCDHGHPLSGENLRVATGSRAGMRVCRTCKAEASRRRYWKNPEEQRGRAKARRACGLKGTP